MLPALHKFAKATWAEKEPMHTWVILEEQSVHNRIADLAVVRLDVKAVLQRLAGNWLKPLRLAEIRAMKALRADRPATARLVASKMRTSQANATEVLRSLTTSDFVEKTADGTYLRKAPAASLAERLITLEAKRDDPRGALQQARSHRTWANETYVAFDSAFSKRFRSRDARWRQLGIGLVELDQDSWKKVMPARPQRRSNRLESALMGELALSRLLGLPATDRPELRLPHGKALGQPQEPDVFGSALQWVEVLRKVSAS